MSVTSFLVAVKMYCSLTVLLDICQVSYSQPYRVI